MGRRVGLTEKIEVVVITLRIVFVLSRQLPGSEIFLTVCFAHRNPSLLFDIRGGTSLLFLLAMKE